MNQRWHYSCWMLVSYVCLFLVWFAFPSRLIFLATGGLVVAGLSIAMRREWLKGYFTNRVDLRLHMLVIADLALETVFYELFRLVQPLAVVESFHRNTHFIGCASSFALLIGCYRLFAVRKAATESPAAAASTQTT